MIIDAHTHIHKNKNDFGENYNASYENLLKQMENSKIDKCLILSIFGLNDNEYISKIVSKYSDKFMGMAGIDPKQNKKNIINNLRKIKNKYEFKGLKLHPRIQEFSITDPEIADFFQINNEHFSLPIIIDLLPYSGGSDEYLIKDNLPLDYDGIAKKFRDTNFILAHFGGHRLWDAFSVAKSNPNIFLDISYILNYYENAPILNDLAYLIKRLGSNKVIYGSDFPESNLNNYYQKTEFLLEKVNLTKKDKNNIYYKNILKILDEGGRNG